MLSKCINKSCPYSLNFECIRHDQKDPCKDKWPGGRFRQTSLERREETLDEYMDRCKFPD